MEKILEKYNLHKNNTSDINEHLETLYNLGKECSHITEMGVRWVSSTWPLVYSNPKKMISYDIVTNPNITEVINLCNEYSINYSFQERDVLQLEIEPTELLFIDTLHTYSQLIKELEIHSNKVSKYIVLHDTEHFGRIDEIIYNHASDVVKVTPTTKQGLMTAVEDFLTTELGQSWELHKVYTNNNGLTVLKNKNMILSNELKLEFLKYLIIGRVGNTTLVNDWVNNGTFPEESVIRQIMNNPIDEHRLEGLDWPEDAVTMIGLKRMNNLHQMLDYVRINNIEGDLMETGVWKGGATIFMKLYCDIYKIDKKVFVCDSFAGLPRPSGKFQQDHGDTHYAEPKLAISLEQVQNNFNIFKCLDEKVIFIKGFFGETLPNNELVDKLAILRMDGDMYESTYDVFYSCYDKLADSGVCIIDDFCLKGARDCTHDFRESRNIHDTLVTIDKCGVYWIKNKI